MTNTEMTDRYRCTRCDGDMPAEFLRSHEAICAWAARNTTRDIGTVADPGPDMGAMLDELSDILRLLAPSIRTGSRAPSRRKGVEGVEGGEGATG